MPAQPEEFDAFYSATAKACRTQTVWTKWFTAPVKKNSNVWGLEYK